MIRPTTFRFNEQTCESNRFQVSKNSSPSDLDNCLEEFNGLQNLLRSGGINIFEFTEPDGADTPDALFPNNSLATFPHGKVVVFPMQAPNRRKEVREDILDFLGQQKRERIDLRSYLKPDEILEGTGSLVLDYARRKGYACLSARTNPAAIRVFEEKLGYKIFCFQACDQENFPIYHTNVMMALGSDNAIVCLESLTHESERKALVRELSADGFSLIEITMAQMNCFAGNMLQLINERGEKFWFCSTRAFRSLNALQVRELERSARVLD